MSDNAKFTELLEDYYTLTLVHGEEKALSWLDEVLQTPDGRQAVKELVIEAVAQAQNMSQSGLSVEEYEEAYEQRKGKKNEDLN